MRTLELLREVTEVGLTDMWLDRLAERVIERVDSVLGREMRREKNWRDEDFPERMTGVSGLSR